MTLEQHEDANGNLQMLTASDVAEQAPHFGSRRVASGEHWTNTRTCLRWPTRSLAANHDKKVDGARLPIQ